MTTNKTTDPKTGQITYGSSTMSSPKETKDGSDKGGVSWAVLNQRHDNYDADKYKKLSLLLKGGFEITKPDNAKLFIKKWNNEAPLAYQDRVKCATYENNFGEIINDFGSSLFAKPLMVTPETDDDDETTPGEEVDDDPDPNEDWMQLQTHFDLQKNTLAQFMRVQQTQSNALGCSYFGMDFSDDDGQPYAYTIDVNSILDYQKDDDGEFVFIVCRNDTCERTNVRQIRNLVTTTFMVWTKDENTVKLDQYQLVWEKGKEPDAEKVVPQLDSKVMSDFSLIPIVECETPTNICVGNTIGQLAESSFIRYSSLLHALNRSSNPILNYKQGPELPANGDLSEVGEDGNRGKKALSNARVSGGALTGPTDELSWVEIKGDALKLYQQQLKDDKNEMYRLVAQLGSILATSSSSFGGTDKTSGDSKQMDHLSKEQMLAAYAELVKKWALKAFQLVFGKDKEQIFKCKGMDNYQVVDEDILLQQVNNIPIYRSNVPSPTSLKEMLLDIANRTHPFTSPGTLKKIRSEIFDNIDKMDLDSLHQAQVQGETMEKTQTDVNGKPTTGPDSKPPPSSSGSSPKVNSKGGSDMPASQQTPEVGETGNKALPTGSHTQTGQHVDPKIVYDMLLKTGDYKPADIKWILNVPVKGPVEVDVSDINFNGQDDWTANKPGKDGLDKVNDFSEQMSDKGFESFNPIILASTPHNDQKYEIIDGRHRVKAAEDSGIPVIAYVVEVGNTDPSSPHMTMHSKQIGKKS